MKAKMKNLFNGEEVIILTLKNISYQVTKYRLEINELETMEMDAEQAHDLTSLSKIFKYYEKKLIPALTESAEMEERHLKVFKKNPDPHFEFLQSEVEFHQHLIHRFEKRFEELHKELHTLATNIKKRNLE